MTLLKAGFISRKRINLLIILFFFILLRLGAADMNVALFADSDDLLSFLSSSMIAFSEKADSAYALNVYDERVRYQDEISYEKELDKAFQNETDLKKVTKTTSNAFISSLDIKIKNISITDKEREYLRSGDKYAYSYFKTKESLDMILYLKSEENGGITFISLLLDGKSIRDGVYLRELFKDEEREIINALLPYFKSDEYKLYELKFPSKSAIHADGILLSEDASFIALKKGIHKFLITNPDYEDKEFEIEAGDESVIAFELSPLKSNVLFISTTPYDAAISYQGNRIESHLIRESIPPFSLTLSKEGFAFYSFESKKNLKIMNLNMKPVWMEKGEYLKREKEEFYASLFTTLLSFGASVGAKSIQKIYSEHDFGPMDVVFTGVSLVSLMYMIDSIFGYYNSAKYGL